MIKNFFDKKLGNIPDLEMQKILKEINNKNKIMPKIELAVVTFTIIPPVECTGKELEQWIKFQLGHGSIDRSNPLQNVELVADTIMVEHKK